MKCPSPAPKLVIVPLLILQDAKTMPRTSTDPTGIRCFSVIFLLGRQAR
jgi:hypothetical protein